MKFTLFKQLYSEALEPTDLDTFITDEWQGKLSDVPLTDAVNQLTCIFNLAHGNFSTNRKLLTDKMTEFAQISGISLRTIQGWDSGKRAPAQWAKVFIDFMIFSDIYG